MAENRAFRIQALPGGNNTANPFATLALLYSNGTTTAPTGLSFNADGTINFSANQLFPGSGAVFTGNSTNPIMDVTQTGSGAAFRSIGTAIVKQFSGQTSNIFEIQTASGNKAMEFWLGGLNNQEPHVTVRNASNQPLFSWPHLESAAGLNGERNEILYWGYNISGGGSKILQGIAQLGFALQTAVSGNQMSWSLPLASRDGTKYRSAMSFTANRDNPDQNSNWTFLISSKQSNGGGFNVINIDDGSPLFRVDPVGHFQMTGTLMMGGNSAQIMATNSQPMTFYTGGQNRISIPNNLDGLTFGSGADASIYRSAFARLHVTGTLESEQLAVSGPAQFASGVAIGTDAAAADAALDLNLGDTKALRLRPRSTPGPPKGDESQAASIAVVNTVDTSGFRLKQQDNLNSEMLSFITADPDAGDFHFSIAHANNPWSARQNQVLTFGYNQEPDGGGSRILTEPALSHRIETFYTPSNGVHWMEAHLQYVGTGGAVLRPYGYYIDRDTDQIQYVQQANSWTVINQSGTPYLRWQGGPVTELLNGNHFRIGTNDASAIEQLSSTGRYLSILGLDGLDRVTLGSTAKGIMLYANTTLKAGAKLTFAESAILQPAAGGIAVKSAYGSADAPLSASAISLGSGGPSWTTGVGAPSGSCNTGSMYSRTDGTANATLYVCESGQWAAK